MPSPSRKFRFQRSWYAGGELRSRVFRVQEGGVWWRQTKFLLCTLSVLSIGWVLLLLYHPYFQIRRISIEAGEYGDAQQYIDWLRSQITKQSVVSVGGNYFVYDAQTHAQALLSAFPLASASIRKEFPGSLFVTVVEKKNEIIVRHNDTLYSFFTNGQVEKISPEHAQSKKVTAHIKGALPESKKAAELTERIIRFTTLIDMRKDLKEGMGGSMLFVFDSQNPYTILVETSRGWNALFDVRHPFELQLDELAVVISTRGKAHVLQTIDLRIPGSAYVTKMQ